MSKFSVVYVKKHPVMFGAIVVVFGLLFWLLLNRGSGGGSAGGVSVVNSGPSDAQVAAGTQLQLAQIGANSQVQMGQLSLAAAAAQIEGQTTIAQMELAYKTQELAAQHDLGEQTIQASLGALQLQLNNQLQTTNSNNQFMVDYAKVAADSATTQLMIGSALQRDLSAQQLEAFKYSTAASIIPTLKKGKRDNAFFALTGTVDQVAMAKLGAGGGGFNPINVISPVTNIVG